MTALWPLLSLLAAAPVAAQVDDPAAARRDSIILASARDPRAVLADAERRLVADPRDHEAHWVAALALIDLGKVYGDSAANPVRDSLYEAAVVRSREAIALDSTGAEGWFFLAQGLGRLTKSKGPKTRLRMAGEIFDVATRCLALDARHHGCLHVLGEWHFEMMKVSGVERFFARTFLGGRVFDAASWDGAVRHLEEAVAIAPWHIFHRLTLATVYRHRRRTDDAITQLRAIAPLPELDRADGAHKAQAAAMLARLDRSPKDKS